jgi:hypothetical protein
MSVVYDPKMIWSCIVHFLSKKETNASPCHVRVITEHQSMDRNPSIPRVPGFGRVCLAVLWHLVFYEVYITIERNALW